MLRLTEIVKVLLTINILFFLGSLFVGEVSYRLFAMFFPLNDGFFIWQLVTHMFMHDPESIHHILMNMLFLVFMGPSLEMVLGKNKFIFLYLSAGLAATLLALIVLAIKYYLGYNALIDASFSPSEIKGFMVEGAYPTSIQQVVSPATMSRMYEAYYSVSYGASGAIFGILAAFARLFPDKQIYLMFVPFGIKAKYLIGAYFGFQVFAYFAEGYLIPVSNTGYLAHIGGAIAGFLIMHSWVRKGLVNRY